MRIINELTPAALAYGLDKNKTEAIAVYRLRRRPLRYLILAVGEEMVEVKSASGILT